MSLFLLLPAGYRPAAVLLHTAETDAAILDLADHLGVGCEQLPAPGVLRKSVRSVWDSGKPTSSPPVLCAAGTGSHSKGTDLLFLYAVSTAKVFFVTTEAANTLRLAPTFARRLNAEGTLCRINLQGFASLVRPALSSALLQTYVSLVMLANLTEGMSLFT